MSGVKREQIPYLHALRILAMLFVIMLHSYTPYFLNPLLYGTPEWLVMLAFNSFCRAGVPLFFMISGFLLLSDEKSLKIGSFYKKRLPRIAVPLAAWSVLYYAAELFAHGQKPDIRVFLSRLFNAQDGGVSYHFWYLYTLLGLYLAAPFIKRIVDACGNGELLLFFAVMVFFTAVMPVVHLTTPVYIYLFDHLFNGYMGYFLFGYILGKAEVSKKWVTFAAAVSVLAGAALAFFGNLHYSSAEAVNPVFNGGYYLNHYLVAGGVFVLFKRFFKVENGALYRGIEKTSQASFAVYFVHAAVLKVITRLLLPGMAAWQSVLVLFAGTAAVSIAAGCVVTKVKFLRGILY